VTLLRSSPDDLLALAGEAADALGIPEPSFVEKDYWVVELLRSVMQPLGLEPIDGHVCSARALLKGGTSLSKVFSIVERFSEDLDILIVHEGLGESARENRVLRPICERARIDLGLSNDDTEVTGRSTGVKRNVAFRYPQRLPSASIRPTAQLEMGIRGGTLPGTVHGTVRSYIAQYVASAGVDADFKELLPVEVEAIAPVRTLAEKVALLHHAGTAALDGDTRSLENAGRHLSDVAWLLSNADVQEALARPDSSMEVLAVDVDEWSARSGWPFTPRPAEGYGVSPAFNSKGALREIAEKSYIESTSLMWGQIPTFDDCLEVISSHTELL
jgi:hypothetical protein